MSKEYLKDHYITIKIPLEIGKIIDDIIDHSKQGFKSRAEVVKAAIRAYNDSLNAKNLL
jgi:Arc/MetJ-type ribon-helix-helix transcriptional regulator